jgi:hypothetical protein
MTIIPSLVGCRPGRLCPQLRSRDDDSFYSGKSQDEIDTRNEISQKKLLRSQFLDVCHQRNTPLPSLKSSNPVTSRFRNQWQDLS